MNDSSVRVQFVLNGSPCAVAVVEDETLLETLRERLGLTSMKDGCSPQGQCGACVVRIDGRPRTTCTLRTVAVAGREVVTNEGLAADDRQILGRCFSAAGAVQCGFCIPGIVARTAVFLSKHSLSKDGLPSRDDIRRQLGPHLCRCTGYVKIIDAIELAVKVKRGEAPLPAPRGGSPEVIGGSSPRYRGEGRALGDAPYVADLSVPEMLHGAVRLSDHPRATIRRIDTRAAEALAGVAAVVTARDVRGRRHVGLVEQDWPCFVAEGEICCMIGDVVAAVAAVDRRTARRAAALVEVDYQILEPIVDVAAAMDPASERVHPDRDNLLSSTRYARGDVEAALSSSAHVVVETFHTQTVEHLYLEPEACLAVPRADASLEIFSQGQGVYDDRRQLSRALDVPEEAVTVTLVDNGGAFGGKEDLSIQVQTALLAQRTERPVKLVLSREESIRLHPKRHPFTMEYAVGCDSSGRLTALRARLLADSGAYASVSAHVVERAVGHACGPYHLPHVAVEGHAVYTNNPPNGAMRGFGVNQVAFAVEQVIDMLAERCGLDPYQMRHKNLLRDGQRFGAGQRMEHCAGLLRALEAVKDAYQGAACAGLACGIKNVGIGNGMVDGARARIDVLASGGLRIAHGMTEMGQGLHGIALQLASEVLGVALGDDTPVEVTTDDGLDSGMTTASRATVLVGNAIIDAATKLRSELDGTEGGLAALAGRSYAGEFLCDWTVKPGVGGDDPITHLSFGYAAQVVILDEHTGALKKVVAAHDVGRVLNKNACEGQIEGSVHMGLGYALSEELVLDGGRPRHTSLRKLGVLRARQTPELEVILIEEPDPIGPHGARGVGEIGLVPTAPAVAAALYCFDRKRRTTLPMRDNYERRRRG